MSAPVIGWGQIDCHGIFDLIASSFGIIRKKPDVGFGVVGTKTLISFCLVLVDISVLFSLVAKPTAQTPFLGYSIRTTLFLPSSFFENVSVICKIAE